MQTSDQDVLISVASAEHNFGDQKTCLEAVPWIKGASLLDIGCGPGVHLDYFRSKGLVCTGLDRNPDYFLFHGQIEHVREINELKGRSFDFIFASHVLEHCPDTFAALSEWRKLLKPGGTLIIFVPPFSRFVSNDHWSTGWNVGQLAMTLVAAGFDCSASTFSQVRNNVFGFGIKQRTVQSFMIDSSLAFLPPAFGNGLVQKGEFQNLRGDIAYACGTRIDYLPCRPSEVSIALPDNSWLQVDQDRWNGGWKDANAVPNETIRAGAEYVIAIDSHGQGFARLALAHDKLKQHGELWLRVAHGMNLRRFETIELEKTTPGFDPEKTDLIAMGTMTPFDRVAMFCEGRRVI